MGAGEFREYTFMNEISLYYWTQLFIPVSVSPSVASVRYVLYDTYVVEQISLLRALKRERKRERERERHRETLSMDHKWIYCVH